MLLGVAENKVTQMLLDVRFMPVSVVSHVIADTRSSPGTSGSSPHTAAVFDFPTAVSVERHSLWVAFAL